MVKLFGQSQDWRQLEAHAGGGGDFVEAFATMRWARYAERVTYNKGAPKAM